MHGIYTYRNVLVPRSFSESITSSTTIFSACEGRSLKVLITTFCAVYPIIRTILSMNMFPAGSRVFFYDSTGQLVRGVVESTSRMADVSIAFLKSILWDSNAAGHTNGYHQTRQWRNYDLTVSRPLLYERCHRLMTVDPRVYRKVRHTIWVQCHAVMMNEGNSGSRCAYPWQPKISLSQPTQNVSFFRITVCPIDTDS
ncbi:hypothetical protein EV421DRAFT_1494607 [Armillaria borealis]|uniref:Uncharacterized protein n=1 Tax=Armillaria borealis TaxID=47425 RepID=A0AA39IY38_9AGAR|nr:hypothetical protein EV421DRAFT_1494607 [Armillaria borealis]